MAHPLEKNIAKVLISHEQIMERVKELGREISETYGEERIIAVCVLKGATPFCVDLIRHITSPLVLDFVAISSYGGATSSSGVVRFQKDLEEEIQGQNVLIIEDIVDTGLTLRYLLEHLRLREPKTLRICSLIDKPARRKTPINVNFTGFTIDNLFILGYGMDYQESYRNIDYVGLMNPEALE